jgi:hypothetical protein
MVLEKIVAGTNLETVVLIIAFSVGYCVVVAFVESVFGIA